MTLIAIDRSEPIYEEHEYCAVCGATVNLGVFDKAITVCGVCYSNGNFQEWLAKEMEAAVAASPDFERLPDGGYRRIKAERGKA